MSSQSPVASRHKDGKLETDFKPSEAVAASLSSYAATPSTPGGRVLGTKSDTAELTSKELSTISAKVSNVGSITPFTASQQGLRPSFTSGALHVSKESPPTPRKAVTVNKYSHLISPTPASQPNEGSVGESNCIICLEPVTVQFVPCGHAIFCSVCAERAKKCLKCQVRPSV